MARHMYASKEKSRSESATFLGGVHMNVLFILERKYTKTTNGIIEKELECQTKLKLFRLVLLIVGLSCRVGLRGCNL